MRVAVALNRFAVVLVAAVVLTGCSGGAPEAPALASPALSASSTPSTPATSPEPTTGATTTGGTVVCPPAAQGASASPAVPGEWPGLNRPAGLSEATEVETAELVAAIGNPDTGSGSPAWEAFEAALGTGDAERIRATSETVIGHLRAACAAVAPYFDQPGASAWAMDVRGLFDGIAGAVAAMSDAAIGHDQAGLDAGRDQMQTALLDHFFQSFKMSDPEAYRTGLRDSQWSATASHVRWITGDVGRAFDGDPATAWLAGNVPAPQWIEVDFGMEV
ncbi:MAG: type domain, partial [Chloroflexota bacterium]|nr:type domain [Chloroflexota bacterium]